jgi:hypothetical protein
MTSHNDITGDKIQTKPTTKEYSDNWDRIFGGCKHTPEGDLDIGACCGGSTSCTAPCVADKCKEEKDNDREIQESK